MLTSKELKVIKGELKQEGLSLTRGLTLTKDQMIDLGKKISPHRELLEWDFGHLMEMKFDPHHKNYLFSEEKVPLHWDGAFHKAPAYILFYCTHVNAPTGGESLFSNTTKLFESLQPEQQEKASKISLRFSTQKMAHYGGIIDVPLVDRHRRTGKPILRIASEVKTSKNPVLRTVTQGDSCFCDELDQLAHHENYLYKHQWQKGDLLIVDNDTYLHGRMPLASNTKRSFYRVQAL